MPKTERERVVVLVKAWPQPSQKYGETVCCAGVTPEGEWRRLFPIRFRHLSGDARFKRWDLLEYRPDMPRDDRRPESRRVDEPTLKVLGKVPERQRADLLQKLIRSSALEAAARGETLALIRPREVRFTWRVKPQSEIDAETARRQKTAAQGSLLDKELNEIEPCPYILKMSFADDAGPHGMACGDWETAAAYFNLRKRYGDQHALEHLKKTYEEEYADGIALALGTVAKRPKQWLMLGVIRLKSTDQASLF